MSRRNAITLIIAAVVILAVGIWVGSLAVGSDVSRQAPGDPTSSPVQPERTDLLSPYERGYQDNGYLVNMADQSGQCENAAARRFPDDGSSQQQYFAGCMDRAQGD